MPASVAEFAHPEFLVETDWLAANLGLPKLRVLGLPEATLRRASRSAEPEIDSRSATEDDGWLPDGCPIGAANRPMAVDQTAENGAKASVEVPGSISGSRRGGKFKLRH